MSSPEYDAIVEQLRQTNGSTADQRSTPVG